MATRGCVGITVLHIGFVEKPIRIQDPSNPRKPLVVNHGFPPMDKCYNSRPNAEKAMKAMKCKNGFAPGMFSVHYYWPEPGRGLPRQTPGPNGEIDMKIWTSLPSLPARPTEGETKFHSFDFAFCNKDGLIGATRCHNPADEKPLLYPDEPIGECHVVQWTYERWENGQRDFNSEVWCLSCRNPDIIPDTERNQ